MLRHFPVLYEFVSVETTKGCQHLSQWSCFPESECEKRHSTKVRHHFSVTHEWFYDYQSKHFVTP